MHNLVATGPYPPGQLPPELDPVELVNPSGLGFVPQALVVAQGAEEAGVFDAVGNFFSGIFGGDTPDHDPEKVREWGANVAAGAAVCAAGRGYRDVAAGEYWPADPGFSEGATYRFDVREVREAIRTAPRGSSGDDPGTVEGLRSAVSLPNPELEPFVRTDDQLARVAVGVAHGRLDCSTGWQEEPAVVHLRQLVEDYRTRPQGIAALPELTLSSLAPGGDMGGLGFLVPLALIGAGVFVATKGMR